jgi:DNA-binding transcriptional ArsR family regulator
MPDQGFIVTPSTPSTSVALEPAHNALYSLVLLAKAEHASGLGDWVTQMANALSAEERHTIELVTIGLHYAVAPQHSWPGSFPAYVDHLAAMEPVALRDRMLDIYASFPPQEDPGCAEPSDEPVPIDREAILASADSYLAFLRERFSPEIIHEELERETYRYVVDPPAMHTLIVSHLRGMWQKYLAAEWERVSPMLQDAVQAFQQIDLSGMGRAEVIQFITGHEIDEEKWSCILDPTKSIVFVPSAHIGPYLGQFGAGTDTRWVLFGARLPRGVELAAPDLSRNEILVRLNALADDNRLRILKLISDQGEQRSPEIISELGVSQSTASRHLNQLTAAGYLAERRCDGAKCYRLNVERIQDTLQAVSAFLLNS